MSQEEPRPELSAECFIYSHPHGHPSLCLLCQDTRGMGISNNVDNSELKLPPPHKRSTCTQIDKKGTAHSLSLCLPVPHSQRLSVISLSPSLSSDSHLSSLNDSAKRIPGRKTLHATIFIEIIKTFASASTQDFHPQTFLCVWILFRPCTIQLQRFWDDILTVVNMKWVVWCSQLAPENGIVMLLCWIDPSRMNAYLFENIIMLVMLQLQWRSGKHQL